MKINPKKALDNLHLSDVYSLMLFLLYKVQDIPEYATLSELCYLLDGANINRLFTFYEGQTIRIPRAEEFVIMTYALLIYQYVNIDNMTLTDAKLKLTDITAKQWDEALNLYLEIVPIMEQYTIDKARIQKHGK